METGTVKFFIKDKGYGFVTGDNGRDYFVLHSGLKQEIKQADRVEFEVQEGKKGLNAVNVKRI